MVSDANMNASIPNSSKDCGKKKRANRTAKLKKCKLDARREQWLSQAKSKVDKDERKEVVDCGFLDRGAEMQSKGGLRCKELDVRRPSEEEVDGLVQHESDTESPAYSPSSGKGSESTFRGSSSSSFSFRSSRGSSSGSFSEEDEGQEEGGDDDDGCLDDWEAVADAMAAAADDKQASDGGESSADDNNIVVQPENASEMNHEGKKWSESVGTVAISAPNSRAWRTGDAFRSHSLPNLLKQRSLPMNADKHGGRGILPLGCGGAVHVPTSCPICCEDLDLTDSRFLPCLCGFRLCLFCHKRILEDDGRCPGCRKPYDSAAIEKQASVSGASLTVRWVCSCSMFSRS